MPRKKADAPDSAAHQVTPAAEAHPAPDAPPTQEQARAMFNERPDLAAVLTVDGELHRDGSLRVVA